MTIDSEIRAIRAADTRDRQVRQSRLCPGCGKTKDIGCVVCWKCFKHRDSPFKYFASGTEYAGDVSQWLTSIGRPTLEEQGIL